MSTFITEPMDSNAIAALSVVLKARAADAVVAARALESDQKQKNDAQIGSLLTDMTPQDMSYFSAAMHMCCTYFSEGEDGCDIFLYDLHDNYGLHPRVININFDLVCRLLCARGMRINKSGEVGTLISVSWGEESRFRPKTEGEIEKGDNVYIPTRDTDPTHLLANEPIYEMPYESDED